MKKKVMKGKEKNEMKNLGFVEAKFPSKVKTKKGKSKMGFKAY